MLTTAIPKSSQATNSIALICCAFVVLYDWLSQQQLTFLLII